MKESKRLQADPLDSNPSGSSRSSTRGVHVIFFDGVCSLCHRLVRFVIHRDGEARFYYASLQSKFARDFLAERGHSDMEPDTIIVIAHYRSDMERLLSKSAASLFILRELGGMWGWLTVVGLLPNRLLDVVYDVVAKTRYRFFGKYDSCSLPDRDCRSRFIEV